MTKNNPIKIILTSRRGAAMIMAMCIMALLATLSLTLTLASASLAAQSEVSAQKQREDAQVESFGKALCDQLMYAPEDSGLYDYLWNNISAFGAGKQWTYYNPDEFAHNNLDLIKRVFTAEDDFSGYEYTVELYWKCNADAMNAIPAQRYAAMELVIAITGANDDGVMEKIVSVFGANQISAASGRADVKWYTKGVE